MREINLENYMAEEPWQEKNVSELSGWEQTREEDGYIEDVICKLECNIDDCSGEAIGFAMEYLLQVGALDVNYTPIFMKKNRPAYLITVLCRPEDRERMEQVLFAETTTIGIRRQYMRRTTLKRENRIMETSLGSVNVKVLYRDGTKRLAPEYESVAAIAREKGIPFLTAFKQVEAELLLKEE